MDTNNAVYVRAAVRYGEVLSHVASDQCDDPTPCDDWTVRDLASHVIATRRRVYALVDSATLAVIDEDAPLQAQWTIVATTVRGALGTESLDAEEVQSLTNVSVQ